MGTNINALMLAIVAAINADENLKIKINTTIEKENIEEEVKKNDLFTYIAFPIIGPAVILIRDIKTTIEDIKKQKEEAEKTGNNLIKEKIKKRALEQKAKMLTNAITCLDPENNVWGKELPVKIEDIDEDNGGLSNKEFNELLGKLLEARIKAEVDKLIAKFEEDMKKAELYMNQINDLVGKIPDLCQSYVTAFATLATQTAGAISAAIMNPGSTAFTTPAVIKAVEDLKKAKSDLVTCVQQLTTCIGELKGCFKLLTSAPVIGPVIAMAINTPLDAFAIGANTAVSVLP